VINLAGDETCDEAIKRELRLARIPVVEATANELKHSEVPFTVAGQLGPFRFLRAWYYWKVSGPMPVEVARLLYADPVGKRDVRAGGHCGCPPPDEYGVTWHHPDTGAVLMTQECWLEYQGLSARHPELKKHGPPQGYAPADDPAAFGRGVVDNYHIDSQEGLDLFVAMVRVHGLAR
jgi:hypothetical protein